MKKSLKWTSLLATGMAAAMAVGDDRTMSFNTDVRVLPAPGPVVVDGEDSDWDLSGGVWCYNDPTIVDKYSLWTHLMWDEKGVYLLARYHDASPMKNDTAGKDFAQSWKADCFQARVIFDDKTPDEHQMHINMFYSSRDKAPYMIVHHGGHRAKEPYDQTGPSRLDQLEKWGPDMLAAGGKIAFKPWQSGDGYTMEAFWPWSYCRTSGLPLKADERFVFGIEAMWGNADGTTLVHRLADGIKDETVNRIFMFRARQGWGSATMCASGNTDVTAQQTALQKARFKRFMDYDTYGSVPISYAVEGKRDVSIVIDDETGKRVRCLFGQYPREAGEVTDLWDCLDDNGNAVAPGKYTATVLSHEPVALSFYNSSYSSATPPWPTEKGTLLWGANHGHPTSVATKGDITILLFTGTEGGSGIQRIDDNGIIQWADGNEFLDGTIGEDYAYALSRSSWQQKVLLFRFNLKTGAIVPFDDADRTPSPTLLAVQEIATSSSLALAHGKLWALIPEHGILRIDPKTGAVEETVPEGEYVALTDRDDVLFGLKADGSIVKLDAALQATAVFQARGVKEPVRLGVSQEGARFAVSDCGSNQVLVYDAKGALLRAIGTAREGTDRPAGTFVATDLVQPMGADFDHLGRLWISESVKTCKRVTCWSPEYELVDQYWGQADYGAMAGFPLVFDATRFVAHGIEFKLDPSPDPLHRKTNEQPLVYHPELVQTRGLIYRLNGHEYACGAPGYNKSEALQLFKRDGQGVFRKVIDIALPGRFRREGKIVDVTSSAWTDLNENGLRDDGEVLDGIDIMGFYWSNGWVRPDLAIMGNNGNLWRVKEFTPSGVPVYDFAHPEKIENWIPARNEQGAVGTPVMDMAGNVCDGIGFHTVDGRTGQWPNRYGRHDAPAAQRGVLIAPFRCNGVVEDVPGAGSLTALGGDRGEWFLMTMDGIFISSICQDIKGTVTMDETFIGGESFGGFIWRDEPTGQIFVQLGGASYRMMKVSGLESCVRTTVPLAITEADIQASAEVLAKRLQTSEREPESLRIARVRHFPTEPAPVMQAMGLPLITGGVDVKVAEEGNPSQWFRASLAHNGRSLAMMFQVSDPSPWKNAAGAYTHAFIGGDAVDLQLYVPDRGPIRVLAADVGGKPTAIYWQKEADVPENPITYSVGNNMNNASSFDIVRVLENATVKVDRGFNMYTVLVTVPLADFGLDLRNLDDAIKGVVGVIYSTPAGDNRAARLYWHNKKTGLVNDVPSESRIDTRGFGPVLVDP